MASRHIAVIASNFSLTFQSKMYSFIRNVAHDPSQRVTTYTLTSNLDLIANVEKRRFASILTAAASQPMAIIGISVRPEPEYIEQFTQAGVPVILIDEEVPGATTIATNNIHGGYIAGQFLVKSGRKHIHMVCGNTQTRGSYNAVNRLEGFKTALLEAGIPLSDTNVAQVTDYAYSEGVHEMNAWILSGRKIDAVFSAAGDECAMGVMRAALEHRLGIPSDVAVIGYDDVEKAKEINPSLTTIRQPLKEMAELAYKMASDPSDELIHSPKAKIFDPEIVVRESALEVYSAAKVA